MLIFSLIFEVNHFAYTFSCTIFPISRALSLCVRQIIKIMEAWRNTMPYTVVLFSVRFDYFGFYSIGYLAFNFWGIYSTLQMKCLKFLRLGFPQVRSLVYLGVSNPPITICIHVLLHTCMPPEIIIIRSWASPFISSAFALYLKFLKGKKKNVEINVI